MPIILRLDRIMVERKMTLKELAENVGISYVNLSKIKTGKVQGIRFSTLEQICRTLDCQPGDILEFQPGEPSEDVEEEAEPEAVHERRPHPRPQRQRGHARDQYAPSFQRRPLRPIRWPRSEFLRRSGHVRRTVRLGRA